MRPVENKIEDKSTTGIFASELHNIFAWVKNMTTFPRTTSHNDILGMSQKRLQAHTHTHAHTNKIHFKDASLNLHSKPLLH